MIPRVFCAAAIALLVSGPVLAQQARGGRDHGRRGGFARGPMGLLMTPDVQKELKMDQAQVDLVQGVLRDRGSRRSFQDFRSLSPEERRKRFDEMRQAQEKKIGEILNKTQLARLKQLELQQTGLWALSEREVADQLKLSADQRQKIRSINDAERESLRAAFQGVNFREMSDAQRQEIRAKFEKLRADRDARLNAVLTHSQRKQFQAMQGAPFKFPERHFGRGGDRNRAARRPNP